MRKKNGLFNLESDDRLFQMLGWFAAEGPSDFIALHKRMLDPVKHFQMSGARAEAYAKNGAGLGPLLPQNPNNEGVSTSLQDWIVNVDHLARSVEARSLWFLTDAYMVKTKSQSYCHMNTTYPPQADLLILDDPKRLGTDNYSLFTIARSIAEALDADGNCMHALMDYDYAGGYNNSGQMYGPIPAYPMTWQMWVDFVDWGTLGEAQATTVRRVVWGTYLGPRMAERLSKNFIDDYLALKTTYFGSPQTAERMPGGGIYLTLTDNPRDQVEHEEFPDIYERPIVRNAAWLRQRLREAGML